MSTDGLIVRKATVDDLQSIDDLCLTLHFEIGVHNLKLYYEACPDWIVVINERKQIVAVGMTNKFAPGMRYAYVTLIREDYRGKKLGKLVHPGIHNDSLMGSSSQYTLHLDSFHSPCFLQKFVGFYGFIQSTTAHIFYRAKPVGRVSLSVLSADNQSAIDHLVRYDAKICMLDRRQFVRQWSVPDTSGVCATVLATDDRNGECLGYGTVRLFTDYYGIQPLYAEHDAIAELILEKLTELLPKVRSRVYLPGLADKRPVLRFCHSFSMICTESEIRNCTSDILSYTESVPISRAYAVHEYFPV